MSTTGPQTDPPQPPPEHEVGAHGDLAAEVIHADGSKEQVLGTKPNAIVRFLRSIFG